MTASWSDVFPSAPIEGETRSTVELVGNDWLAENDWARFVDACQLVGMDATPYGTVDPNKVRRRLTNEYGLTIAPRRLSAFWARATSKNGFLDNTGEWTVNDDHKGGNAGKPLRLRRLREAS